MVGSGVTDFSEVPFHHEASLKAMPVNAIAVNAARGGEGRKRKNLCR